MNLNHIIGQSIELADSAKELPLWRYVYGGRPKPYFHPVCTPAGHCLTLFEPHDHVWHRGLWYTIKFINGENFWEERERFGTQRIALPPSIEHLADGRIVLRSELDWVHPDGRSAVFHEQRQIGYAPLNDQAYALDFQTTLTAQADLTLDRTLFTTWGGYGATGAGHYFNAAFLFHEPMGVASGQALTFRYRVLVHDQIWDVTRLQAAYEAYITKTVPVHFGLNNTTVIGVGS